MDRFKLINDQYSHEFGDKALIQLGCIIRSFAAEPDILIGRHGGEEFALVIGINNEQCYTPKLCVGFVQPKFRRRADRRMSQLASVLHRRSGRQTWQLSCVMPTKPSMRPNKGGANRVVQVSDGTDRSEAPRFEGGRRLTINQLINIPTLSGISERRFLEE
jgi:hypothetical protein